jgi:hypothetical protein
MEKFVPLGLLTFQIIIFKIQEAYAAWGILALGQEVRI